MNRRALLLIAGASALAGPAFAAARPLPLTADLDAAIARAMALGLAPGLSVAVYSREGVYARGFGVTDVTTGEAATADTAFYVASSTKSLTSLALAALHQRGKLDLDATLAAYAPDAPFPASVRANEVRLRDLLSHTGGIENHPIGYRLAFTGVHDPKLLWKLLAASQPNAKAPLGRFQYTNIGYNIATILTDRRLGVRWQDLVQREVFTPAGMTRASATMSRPKAAGWSIAKPHSLSTTGRVERIALEKTDQTMQSAGGVIMSARDAARWLEFMIEGGRLGGRQVVDAEAVRATCAPRADVGETFAEYRRERYGLGWYQATYRGEEMLHDFGGFAGFRSHVSFLPQRGVGVAAFVNDSTVAFPLVDAIANYVYDSVAGRPDAAQRYAAALAILKPRRDILLGQLTARAARPWLLGRPKAAYTGAYENPDWGRIEVAVRGEAIEARFGVMRALADPYTLAESIRVDFGGNGEVLLFEGAGPTPASLSFDGQRFGRVG